MVLQDDSAKKEFVPDSPDVSAVATEGEESPAKKENVLDTKPEETNSALVSEAKAAKESGDDAGKRDYGWGGHGGGYGGYGGHGGGYGGYGGHHGGYGGYGGHGHGEHGGHGHHEHGHDNHDHG